VCVAAALLLSVTAPTQAEAQVGVGGDVSYNNNVTNGSWGFGGRVGVQLPNLGFASWKLLGSGVWYIPSCGFGTCDWYELQGTLLFARPTQTKTAPYFGLGATYQRVNLQAATVDDSFWGLDLLIGTPIGQWGPVLPYAEVRYKFMETIANQFAFLLGFGFGG
jgi:hypothetical protein